MEKTEQQARKDLAAIERGTAISVIPGLMPDESIWGYVARISYLNQATEADVAFRLFGGVVNVMRDSAQPLPRRMATFVSRLPWECTSAEHLGSFHTVLPLLSWSLDRKDLESAARDFGSGRRQGGILKSMGLAGAYPRHCRSCAEEDLREYGFSYWRRGNELRFITHCGRHRTPLVAGCGTCVHTSLIRSGFPLPSDTCACGARQQSAAPDVSEAARVILKGIARIATEMMECAAPDGVTTYSAETFRRRLIALGCGSSRGVSVMKVESLLKTAGVFEALSAVGVSPANVLAVRDLYLGVGKHRETTALRLALIALLFPRGREGYVQACFSTRDSPILVTPAPPLQEILNARTRLQKVSADLGTVNRTALAKRFKGFPLLRTFDSEWLNREFPRAKTTETSHNNWLNHDAKRDLVTSNYVQSRAKALLASSGPPVRVCVSTVMKGLRGGRGDPLKAGPLTKETFEAVLESVAQFQVRKVYWAIANAGLFSTRRQLRQYIRNLVQRRMKIADIELLVASSKLTTEHVRGECFRRREASTGNGIGPS